MAEETNLTRRASLKLVGMLGALGATAAFARDVGYSNGNPSWHDPDCLELPHTEMTAVDMVTARSLAALTNDFNAIMSTDSKWDYNDVFLWANPDGTLTLKTAFTLAEVEELEASVLAGAHYPGGELHNYDHPGRWFDLLDSQYYSIDSATGVETSYRAAFLFVTWPDGLSARCTGANQRGPQPSRSRCPSRSWRCWSHY